MKKMMYVIIFIVVMLVSFLEITYSYEYGDKELVKFELIGPSTLYVDVNTEYVEYGIKVINNKGVDISSLVKIDSSLVNMSELGKYKVKYELEIDGNFEYIYRDVIVIDKISPEIKLKGNEVVYVVLNGNYYDDGYIVSDNYDTDLDDKVIVSGSVDTGCVGEYEILYSVKDLSGNESKVIRKVIVIEPEVTLANVDGNKYNLNAMNVLMYQNTVYKNSWIDDGIYIEGYIRDGNDRYTIGLKNKDNGLEYVYEMNGDNGYYSGNVLLDKVTKGTYDVFINGYKLVNKMDGLSKLVRARIGDKLISVSYNDDIVNFVVNDFSYEYDVLIDPGHGDSDIGASNGIVNEKFINLKQSMYEKCRYESMGLKVYMTRYDDSYGMMLGSNKLDRLQRRALTMGYYGVVSKVVYSNHHNASYNSGDYGFEILVSNRLGKDDLGVEIDLYNKYKKYYKIDDDVNRLYSRDYISGVTYDKSKGDVYSYIDYYAVIRIPMELFDVKSVIYEPIYLSNSNDFSWYYTNNKWIEVTELKIEEYVKYLGKSYNSDNSMCL